MLTEQFLAAVLPATGNYVLHTHNTRHDGTKWMKNIHAATIKDTAEKTAILDAHDGVTVFYALGAFENNLHDGGKVGRTAAEAVRFKTLAFDVDPKDRLDNILYADQRSMGKAVLTACDTLGLPAPVFVSSGNGLHCYYPLTIELSKPMWVRLSSALRDALLSTGMALDTSKICDASMVLRPIGTRNKKGGVCKEVKLLSEMKSFDPMLLATQLKKFTEPSKKPPGKKSAIAEAILDTEFPPADASLIAQRCYHISVVAQSGGKVDEPTWYRALGIAKHCIDPIGTAHQWSMGDERYTEDGTNQKLAQWKVGPTTCKAFEELDATPCKNCSHRGRIASPVQLGIPEISEVVETLGRAITMPPGYTVHGGKILRNIDAETVPVCDYILYPTTRYRDAESGKSCCLVMAKLPLDGWTEFELPMDSLCKPADFSLWLTNNQLFIHSEAMLLATRKYMVTYLQELQQLETSEAMCGAFGWFDDDSTEFVLGNRIIKHDGESPVRLTDAARSFESAFVPKGDKAKWAEYTKMFDKPGMELHGAAFLMSVGSILMEGSGLKSVLVNLFCKDSGTGKTTVGLFANSLYGDAHKLALTVKDTDNSMFKRMGVYGNLPVYIDEITDVERDRLGKTLYFITQGREKTRMNRSGGFQEAAEWRSISMSSSNKDMYALLGDQATFDGEAMRLLQIELSANETFNDSSTFGYEVNMFLAKNYALWGEDTIRAVSKIGGPAKVFPRALEKLLSRFNFEFAGKERHWQAAVACGYGIAEIGKAVGAFQFDTDRCISALLEYVRHLRRDLSQHDMDSFDTMGVYLTEHSNKTAVFRRNTSSSKPGSVQVPYPQEAVARLEIICTDVNSFTAGKVFVSQADFNRWCRERGIDKNRVLRDLEGDGVSVSRTTRTSLMRGTDRPTPSIRVYDIDLTHQRFAVMAVSAVGVSLHTSGASTSETAVS